MSLKQNHTSFTLGTKDGAGFHIGAVGGTVREQMISGSGAKPHGKAVIKTKNESGTLEHHRMDYSN